jgi:YHS domain-containing protein
MKRVILALSVGAMVVGAGLLAVQAAPKKAPAGDKKVTAAQINCPVMGDAVNFYVHTDTSEGPVYFCCNKCIEKFNGNKAKYETKAAEQRKLLAELPKTQVTCPVSGDPVDPKVSTDYNGEKVQFCCKKCVEPFTKDAAKYKAKLAASYTYQTKCPISGEPIDPKASAKMPAGETVYFCCTKCAAKMKADPAKYAKSLQKQGYELDLEKK